MADLNKPQTFLAKYNLYKKATEYIGGWIAETAASIGFEIQEKGKDKPKAKPKKRGGKKNHKKAKPAANTIYRMRVSDFVPMANAIAEAGAEADSEIMVPIALCKYFNRAIQTRRQVSRWFKAKVDGDRESDLRHEYFIQILEDTFATLRPFLGSGGPQAARNNGSAPTQNGLATQNRFAGLTVEEAAALADEEDIPEDDLPKFPKVELQEDDQGKEGAFWIAVSLLLQEQQDMREVVRDTWEKYRNGKVDLIVAAMATDTAIKLANNSEAQFELLVERPKKYPAAEFPVWTLPAILFYNNHESMQQWPIEEIMKPSKTLGGTTITQAEAHFDIWPVYAGLKFYLHKDTVSKSIAQVLRKDITDTDVHERTLRAIELAQIHRLIGETTKRPKLWDMVSQGLQDMFKTRKIPIWLTFGVQLHLDSQDILGVKTAQPHSELGHYLNATFKPTYDICQNWQDPFLHDKFQSVCYKDMIDAFNDISPWVNEDGLAKQWAELAKKPKIAGHPVLKTLRSEEYYFYKRNPLLVGMMKYHFSLHWHTAGVSHEATSGSIFIMAHIYVGARLRRPEEPVWPDMEFVLYNQDPRYVLYKMPDTPDEARTSYDLATGQHTVGQLGAYSWDRLDFSRDDLGLPRYDPNTKAHLFRDASVFGENVYAPSEASGYWIKETIKQHGGAFSGTIDKIATALLQASRPNASFGRLARAIQAAEPMKMEPLTGKEGLTSLAILQHFVVWLQADTTDLSFDWTLMQRQCSDAWKRIFSALNRDPLWTQRFGHDTECEQGRYPPAQRAASSIISTGPLTGNYPRFMDITATALREYLKQSDERTNWPRSEMCLRSMIEYHPKTARMFRDDGPLSVDTLYKCWTDSQKRRRRDLIKGAVASTESDS